jgi:serine kinase of HPr protein (carbohydrate metabolism regulator)
MSKVLLTGMSGTGKSAHELHASRRLADIVADLLAIASRPIATA